jgi:hypothetical protein
MAIAGVSSSLRVQAGTGPTPTTAVMQIKALDKALEAQAQMALTLLGGLVPAPAGAASQTAPSANGVGQRVDITAG